MKHTLALLFITAVFVIATQQASAQDVAPKPATAARQSDIAFAALEGEWVYEKFISAGAAVPKESFPHEVHFKSPNQLIMKGITVGQVRGKDRTEVVILDDAKMPAHMDMTRLVRGDKQTAFAIYKIEGDILTICFSRGADRKPSTERPTAFESDPKTKADVLVLKRKAKASR